MKILNVPINVHWSFWLLITLVVIGFFSQLLLLHQVWLIVFLYISILLHELGHVKAAQNLKLKVNLVTISLLGGVTWIERVRALKNTEDIYLAFSGPKVNLMLAALFLPFFIANIVFLPNVPVVFSIIPVIVNLMLFGFNMLPISNLDGGIILKNYFEIMRIDMGKSKYIRKYLSLAILFILFILGFNFGFIDLVVVSAGLFVTTFLEIEV